MATVRKNVLLEGLSGRVGDLVLKDYGDKVVLCRRPVHDPKRVPKPGEARQRERIRAAAAMARAVLATVEGEAYYQAARRRLGKHSAYHTAVCDFLGTPEVVGVRLAAGGELLIEVWDDVGVRQVTVAVNGEEGAAEAVDGAPWRLWRWRLGGAGPWAVEVRAVDGMGNVGQWSGQVGE
jgi:hypothetical protein